MQHSIQHSLRPRDAAKAIGVALPTFWRFTKRPDSPPLIRLSKRCTVVDGPALIAWRDAQLKGGSQ